MRRREPKLKAALRATVPVVISVLLILASMLPFGLPLGSGMVPLVTVMSVYYWSVYRPELMPIAAAFGIGLLQDLMSGGPLGLMAIVLIVVRTVCVVQRRTFVSESILLSWSGFIAVSAGVGALLWLIGCAYHLMFIDPRPLLAQMLLTVALYPVFDRLFSRTEHRLLRPA